MNEVLKRCPLCGSSPVTILEHYSCACSRSDCPLSEPLSIYDWETRPMEDALQKELNDCRLVLDKTQAKLDSNENKLIKIAEILAHIARTKITIILEDGTILNDSELANNALEIMKYE